jgi:hypothetical protein
MLDNIKICLKLVLGRGMWLSDLVEEAVRAVVSKLMKTSAARNFMHISATVSFSRMSSFHGISIVITKIIK